MFLEEKHDHLSTPPPDFTKLFYSSPIIYHLFLLGPIFWCLKLSKAAVSDRKKEEENVLLQSAILIPV